MVSTDPRSSAAPLDYALTPSRRRKLIRQILLGKSKTIRMHFIATGALGAGSFISYVFATLDNVTTQSPGTAFTVVPPSDG